MRRHYGLCGWAIAACLLGTAPPEAAGAAPLPIEGAAAEASYWQRADGDTPLMAPQETAALNARIAAATDTLDDLSAVPETISGDVAARRIAAAAQEFSPDTVPGGYLAGTRLTAERWDEIWRSCALDALPARVAVRRAVTVRRTDVRLLPCPAGLYEEPDETRYDALQGSALDPGTAVLLFHTSADGAYGFVLAPDYRGWVRTADIAAAEYRDWQRYLAPPAYAVVTAPTLRIDTGGGTQLYELGARIPAADMGRGGGAYAVRVPVRDAGGHLAEEIIPLPHAGLSVGTLAPTRSNLLRLAFAPLGTEYGWGGENDGMDCSSYVRNIYRAMGIILPRDADEQERALGRIALTGRTSAERAARLGEMPAGTLLFRPGHVMLYLGADAEGTPLVIHDISSYYEDGTKRYVRQVAVSDLNFQNARGAPAIDTLTHIGQVLP